MVTSAERDSILSKSSKKEPVHTNKYNLNYKAKQPTGAGPHKRYRDGTEKKDFSVLDVLKKSDESKKKAREQYSDPRARDQQRRNFDLARRTNPILAAELYIPETENNEDKEIEALLKKKVRSGNGKVIAAFTSWKEKVNDQEIDFFKCWICNSEVEGKGNLMGHVSSSRHLEKAKDFGEVPLSQLPEPQQPERGDDDLGGGRDRGFGSRGRGKQFGRDREFGDRRGRGRDGGGFGRGAGRGGRRGGGWGDRGGRREEEEAVHPWGNPDDLYKKQVEVLAKANRIAPNQSSPGRVNAPAHPKEVPLDEWERNREPSPLGDDNAGGGFDDDGGYSPTSPPRGGGGDFAPRDGGRGDFAPRYGGGGFVPRAAGNFGVAGAGSAGLSLPKPVPSLPKPVPFAGHINPFKPPVTMGAPPSFMPDARTPPPQQDLFPIPPMAVSPDRDIGGVSPPASKRPREGGDDDMQPPEWDAAQSRIISNPHFHPGTSSFIRKPEEAPPDDSAPASPPTMAPVVPTVPVPVPAPSPERRRPTLSTSELSKLPAPMSYEDRVNNHLGTLSTKPNADGNEEPVFDIDPTKSFLDPVPGSSSSAAAATPPPARGTLQIRSLGSLQQQPTPPPPPPEPTDAGKVSADFTCFLDTLIDKLGKKSAAAGGGAGPAPPLPSEPHPNESAARPPPPPATENEGEALLQQFIRSATAENPSAPLEDRIVLAQQKMRGLLDSQRSMGNTVTNLKTLATVLKNPPPPPPPPPGGGGGGPNVTENDIDDFMSAWCEPPAPAGGGDLEPGELADQPPPQAATEQRSEPAFSSALAKLRARKALAGGGGGGGPPGRDHMGQQPMDLDEDDHHQQNQQPHFSGRGDEEGYGASWHAPEGRQQPPPPPPAAAGGPGPDGGGFRRDAFGEGGGNMFDRGRDNRGSDFGEGDSGGGFAGANRPPDSFGRGGGGGGRDLFQEADWRGGGRGDFEGRGGGGFQRGDGFGEAGGRGGGFPRGDGFGDGFQRGGDGFQRGDGFGDTGGRGQPPFDPGFGGGGGHPRDGGGFQHHQGEGGGRGGRGLGPGDGFGGGPGRGGDRPYLDFPDVGPGAPPFADGGGRPQGAFGDGGGGGGFAGDGFPLERNFRDNFQPPPPHMRGGFGGGRGGGRGGFHGQGGGGGAFGGGEGFGHWDSEPGWGDGNRY